MLVPLHPVRQNLVALGKKAERVIRAALTKFHETQERRRIYRANALKSQRETEQRRLAQQQEEFEYEQRNAHLRVQLLDTIPAKAENFGRQLAYADELSARNYDGPWRIDGYTDGIGFVFVSTSGELLCNRKPVELASKSYRTLAGLDARLDRAIDKINALIKKVEDAERASQEATVD